MKKPNKYFNPAAVLCLFLIFPAAPGQAADAKFYFNLIKDYYSKNTPSSFSVPVESLLIEKQLKNIPKDMIVFGKKPFVTLNFKRGHEPRIIIENVSDFYKNMLSIYEEFVSASGLFFGIKKIQTFEDFQKEYKMKPISEKKIKTILQVEEIDGLKGNYGLFTIGEDGQIIETEFFENNTRRLSCKFEYLRSNKTELPVYIIIDFLDETLKYRNMWLRLGKYNFKNLEDSLFTD